MRNAVIGIGSNSVRMLVAETDGTKITPVLRERCGTRLFAGLENGALTPQSIEVSCAAAREMARKAREAGAGATYIFATSAVRDAKNRDEFAQRIRSMTGLTLDVCSGEEEARLSYAGAALGGRCGMIDIGGGSTEITIGEGDEVLGAVSTQMGAVRFHRLYPIQTPEAFEAVSVHAQEVLREGAAEICALARPDVWVGVGGTFTSLGAMDKQLKTFDRSLVEGYPLTQDAVCAWGWKLSVMPLEERLKLPGLQPQRADIVVHGMAILLGCMRHLDIETIRVSDKGNLDGYLRKKLLKKS